MLQSYNYSKSTKSQQRLNSLRRNRANELHQINFFIDTRLDRKSYAPNNNHVNSYLKLAKLHFDIPTIVSAMVICDRLRPLVSMTQDELVITCLTISDLMINDRPQARLLQQASNAQLGAIDEKIAEIAKNYGELLFVTDDQFQEYKRQFEQEAE